MYDNSGNLDEYKNGFVVKFIDGRDNSVEFLNGVKIFAGDVIGKLSDKKAGTSDDIDAYDLIMKNKELLLDRDPKRSPVRFIFSHSALREGWDNPNVFQFCTLNQTGR